MDLLFDFLDPWLIDVYLLSTILMAIGLVCQSRLRQPSRRMTMARSVVAGLAVLAVLSAMPGWPRAGRLGWLNDQARSNPKADFAPMVPGAVPPKPFERTAMTVEIQPSRGEATIVDRDDFPRSAPVRSEPRAGRFPRQAIVCMGFLVGASLNLAWLGLGAIEATRLRRSLRRPSPRLEAMLMRIAGDHRQGPRAGLSGRIGLPVALGGFRPTIVLPVDFAESEPDDRIESALAHEWAHIRNGDLRWLAAIRLIQVFLFAHPLYWWLRRSIHADQETLADASAASLHGDGRLAYAATLVGWARSSREPRRDRGVMATAALALWERPSLLQRRVRVLLDPVLRVEPASPRGWRLIAAGAGILVAALLSMVSVRPEEAAAQEMPARPKEGTPTSKALKSDEPGDRFDYAGQVVGPDGMPVAGARLHLGYFGYNGPAPPAFRASSDAEGRFRFAVTRADFLDTTYDEPWTGTQVVATAPGFAPGWADASHSHGVTVNPTDLTVRLSPGDMPIRGRIVDLEGRGITGVTIRMAEILEPERGDLSAWIAASRSGKGGSYEIEREYLKRKLLPACSGLPIEIATDSEGRFTIRGVGRERVTRLKISGPTVQTKEIGVLTKAVAPFEVNHGRGSTAWGIALYYGASFTHVPAPTKVVVGIVKDKDTGRPLAGVRIASDRTAEFPVRGFNGIESTSESDGRYRLVGLPKGKGNHVIAIPAKGQPYLASGVEIPDSPGLGPVALDLGLKGGIVIEGRVTDKETGKPLRAFVEYNTARDNPHLAEAPGFDRSHVWGRYRTEADGSFRVVSLPGRGLVSAIFIGEGDRYLKGVGMEGDRDDFRIVPNSMQSVFNVISDIDVPSVASTVHRDLALERGLARTIRVLDPEGRPVAGARTQGHGLYANWSAPRGLPEFRVEGLRRGEKRRISALIEARKLAGWVELLADEREVVELKLQPWATVVGRLVDADGEPRAHVDLVPDPHQEREFETDSEGRFRIEGLIPGRPLAIWVSPQGGFLEAKIAGDMVLGSGEVKDLGDVKEKK